MRSFLCLCVLLVILTICFAQFDGGQAGGSSSMVAGLGSSGSAVGGSTGIAVSGGSTGNIFGNRLKAAAEKVKNGVEYRQAKRQAIRASWGSTGSYASSGSAGSYASSGSAVGGSTGH